MSQAQRSFNGLLATPPNQVLKLNGVAIPGGTTSRNFRQPQQLSIIRRHEADV